MSETDDTDVLLLIPPNFFLVPSSGSEESLLDSSRTVVHNPPSCTAQVLGKLVNQVHSLENRLDSLEISTDTLSSHSGRLRRKKVEFDRSFDSTSLNSFGGKYSTFPRRRRRVLKRDRKQDLSLTSLDSSSTYSKVIPPLLLNKQPPFLVLKHLVSPVDDFQSMDGDLSSIVSTPSKKNDKLLLHEIDEFLTRVETYESPESKHRSQDAVLSPENIIKAAGDYLTQKMDDKNPGEDVRLPSGRIVSSNVLDKYIYLVKNSAASSSQYSKAGGSSQPVLNPNEPLPGKSHEVTPKSQESKLAQESKSPSVRKLNFLEVNKDIQPTSTPKRNENTNSNTFPRSENTSINTFRPSTNKIYERASKVLDQYKQGNSQMSLSIDTNYLTSFKKEDYKSFEAEPRERPKASMLQSKYMDTVDTELLSLSELWGEKKEDRGDSLKLEEERMKREHCESLIQELQKKLLEQQERLAVAIKVDRTKDAAIAKLREAWLKLTNGLERTEERHRSSLEKMAREVERFKAVADEAGKKAQHFECELYKALDLAHDYQEKCKHLSEAHADIQGHMDNAIAGKDQIIRNKDREMEVLRDNYETAMRLNKQSADCVKNVEDALQKERHEHEETKIKLTELLQTLQSIQQESDNLRRERDGMMQRVEEERARCNTTEKKLAEMQNQNCDLLRRCDTLENDSKTVRKHLELQKNELKTHYQKQLEDAVLSKLQEFQLQLENSEREMDREMRRKETACLESCRRQIERIEEQHKLEVKVLEEKHKEEIKLYRLQLAQAGEKIGLLESKVSSYRSRRGELAERLHSVMEAQWRQALRILTAPGGHTAGGELPSNHRALSTPDLQDCKLSLPSRSVSHRHNYKLDLDGLSDTDLQGYVKLLLTKPPAFLDGSGDGIPTTVEDNQKERERDIAEEPTSDRADAEKRDRDRKRSVACGKPPWKS